MYLSAATLVLCLHLVAAAPRNQVRDGNFLITVNIDTTADRSDASDFALIKTAPHSINPHDRASDVIQVDVTSTSQSILKSSNPSSNTVQEQIPGWMFFDGKRIQARIHGNTFWNIKGELYEQFPIEELLLDPLIFSLNHPMDFEGEFTGKIGRGEAVLTWVKSGATIKGRAGVGDFEIKGKTYIDWSP